LNSPWNFRSGLSPGFVLLSIDGNTVPARAMLSVCDTAINTKKISLNLKNEAAQCHWT